LNSYSFHIDLYGLVFLGIIFTGLIFALLLWLTKSTNRSANRFLSLALIVVVLQISWLLCIDMRLEVYFPRWSWLPLQFSLALGPLIFFYVRKKTRAEYKFNRKDILHFSPLLFQLGILALAISESSRTGTATYDTTVFHQLNPVLQLASFSSVFIYLYLSHRSIENFYQGLKFNDGDRSRRELRWLHRLLAGLCLAWLLWILYAAIDYFGYHHQLDRQAYYPLYILLAAMIIRIGALAYLRPGAETSAETLPFSKPSPSTELKHKGAWLKNEMETNQFHLDAELSLSTLAEKLGIHPHELSRIINVALKKNLNDFINEYRVAEVARKMQDPAYDRMTLIGIAYGSGFNSKSTFNRAFREMTGKSPAEYKKERPTYHLRPFSRSTAIISNHETTPKWSHEKLKRNYMFRNYLKIAWRNLSRNKASSFINIAGLSVGLACSLLILLWVQNEYSMDAWHPDGARLYAIYERMYFKGKAQAGYGTPALTADELKKVIPEVQYAAQVDWGDQNTFRVGEKVAKMNGYFASADYFKMFGNKLLQGNAQNALNTPASISISRKMAVQFYGSPEAAIGKSIRFENMKDFVVGAVFEDLPITSSEKFDYLVNWYEFMLENGWANDWGNSGPRTYIMLRGDANPMATEKKLAHFMDIYNKNQKPGVFTLTLGIQPYNEIYLHGNFAEDKLSGGRIEYARLFSIIAIFILLIACINFMNLSTARSLKRAREIGVRKVIGALRSNLIRQFISESMLVTILAVGFSLILLIVLLPVFNKVTMKEISLPFGEPAFWLKLTAITILTGLLSGSYPALFMSSFNPVKVIKGALKTGHGIALFRKSLVVFQFVLSTVLIIGTVVISRQINYIQTKNLGYDRENLVYLPLDGNLPQNYDVLKNEALQQAGIQSVTRIDQLPTNIENGTGGVEWTGKDPDNRVQFTQASIGYDFVKSMKIKMLTGRDYSKDFPSDSVGYLVNETALKAIGYENPVGKPLTFWGKKGRIIGVIKDFHFNSLHEQIKPLVLRLGENAPYGSALIRTQPGKTKEALASLQAICKQLNPDFAFIYTFSDDAYQKLYQNEQVTGKLSDAFSFLAIFISGLGLLGLAMFTAEQRVKEIGIRKVLGASVGSVFGLLSKEFLALVAIALVIAIPVAWYAMDKWLENFQYYAAIQWWIFGLSAMLIMLIALAIISFQTIKAALVNPVNSLRSE
jgi:ABC-type antimicrobial peptide transport system permease subunit/AraC-like DNA-binding protein